MKSIEGVPRQEESVLCKGGNRKGFLGGFPSAVTKT